MAKIKWKHKFAASTVLEVIIAMIIILVVLGLGLTIYSNVMRQSTPARQIRARMIIKKMLISTPYVAEGVEEQAFGQWTARLEHKPYQGNTALTEVQVEVIDENGTRVAGSRQVITNTPKP